MVDRDDLRQQMIDAFEGADYPISSPMDLVPALPNGPSTTFESGDFSMTAMELNTKLSGGDFPYDSAEAFVDDVVDELENQDLL
ncbi:MAG: MTH865 family protein [Halorientalis sp.]